MTIFPTVRVAVVQAAPVVFDRAATIQRVSDLAAQASARGASLIVFPEAFIPAYPRGLSFGAVVGSRSDAGRDLWARYWSESIDVPGADVDSLGEIARRHAAHLVVGVIEREGTAAGGTLYCTTLYLGPDGSLLGKHRKLKPTGSERLIWGEGDGSTLTVVDTPWGRLGGLTCWENYMPLARVAMYAQGIDFWVAPTADARDAWQATMRHVALEGRCFVLGCNQYVRRADYPDELREQLATSDEELCAGGSVVVSPLGEVIAGPVFGGPEILVADLDTREIARARYDFEPVGHYARNDIFSLRVDRSPRRAVEAEAESPAENDPER
jgi:nitrilase